MRVENEQPKVAETGAKFIWQWLNLGTFWPALRGVHKPNCISLPELAAT